ncbi:hypothetical protein BGZ89_006996, partial [Linnemannia elongata]
SLTLHVLGSDRPSNRQDPCPKVSAKAIEIARTREIFDDEEMPITYEPVEPKIAVPDRNKQQRMESPDNDEDEELELNNDEEGVHHNNYEDEESDDSDDIQRLLEENDHIQRLLKKNARALQKAMESNHKARSVIHKAQLKRRVKK